MHPVPVAGGTALEPVANLTPATAGTAGGPTMAATGAVAHNFQGYPPFDCLQVHGKIFALAATEQKHAGMLLSVKSTL